MAKIFRDSVTSPGRNQTKPEMGEEMLVKYLDLRRGGKGRRRGVTSESGWGNENQVIRESLGKGTGNDWRGEKTNKGGGGGLGVGVQAEACISKGGKIVRQYFGVDAFRGGWNDFIAERGPQKGLATMGNPRGMRFRGVCGTGRRIFKEKRKVKANRIEGRTEKVGGKGSRTNGILVSAEKNHRSAGKFLRNKAIAIWTCFARIKAPVKGDVPCPLVLSPKNSAETDPLGRKKRPRLSNEGQGRHNSKETH